MTSGLVAVTNQSAWVYAIAFNIAGVLILMNIIIAFILEGRRLSCVTFALLSAYASFSFA